MPVIERPDKVADRNCRAAIEVEINRPWVNVVRLPDLNACWNQSVSVLDCGSVPGWRHLSPRGGPSTNFVQEIQHDRDVIRCLLLRARGRRQRDNAFAVTSDIEIRQHAGIRQRLR